MLYLIYDYYYNSDLSLLEFLKDYTENFYLRKYGRDKVEKVLYKVSDSSKMNDLIKESKIRGIAPNYIDFGSVVNEIMWFMIQSNRTQALGVLAAAITWDQKVNCVENLKSERDLRDDTIKIFKKFSIYEDMTQEQFESMSNKY